MQDEYDFSNAMNASQARSFRLLKRMLRRLDVIEPLTKDDALAQLFADLADSIEAAIKVR